MQNIAIIGGGINGVLTALKLANKGIKVHLIEGREDILMGATRNNSYRLHLGPHYPLDKSMESAHCCIEGAIEFIKEFPDCLNYRGFLNVILNGYKPMNNKYSFQTQSMIDAEEYLHYIRKNNQFFKEIAMKKQLPNSHPLMKTVEMCYEIDPIPILKSLAI